MASADAGVGITKLLDRIRGGDRAALDILVPLVYNELHRLAADQMHRDRFSITLQPTALIHEAFLRIFGSSVPSFNDRSHFLGIVSRVMRQVLVDHARRRRAQKRGRGLQVSLEGVVEEPTHPAIDLLEMNDVLERLGREDPRLLTLVEMRFFAGMTAEETAEALGESVNVVRHNIRYALASLRRDLDPTRARK
jgi:RNA polymerase sigma-70 factor (ECF subfamily)